MRAFVQQVSESTPNFLQLHQAAYWFAQRGDEVIRFDFAEIDTGRIDAALFEEKEDCVLRGGVEAVRRALVRAGRPLPPNLDLPPSLNAWFGRSVWESTLGELRKQVDSAAFVPVHVKPLKHHKLFAGRIVRAFRDLISTASLPDQTPILAQQFVTFVSEWRATILRDRVLNVANYKGDPLAFPDPSVIASAIPAFDDRPVAFAMDWGVTAEGTTLLVEVNDGYSLGNYGVRGPEFVALIEARWRQLMGCSDNGVASLEE